MSKEITESSLRDLYGCHARMLDLSNKVNDYKFSFDFICYITLFRMSPRCIIRS